MKMKMFYFLALAACGSFAAGAAGFEKLPAVQSIGNVDAAQIENVAKFSNVAARNTNTVISKELTWEKGMRVAPMRAASDMTVKYRRPLGYFKLNFSEDMRNMNGLHLFGPAYTESIWINQSSEMADFQWQYLDPASFDSQELIYLYSSEVNLTTPEYPFSSLEAPVLSVGENSYSEGLVYLGGDGTVTYYQNNQPGQMKLYAGNFDISQAVNNIGAIWFSTLEISNTDDAKDFWGATGLSNLKIDGFSTTYLKPEKPYALFSSRFFFSTDALGSAELTCYVYNVDDEGKIDMENPLSVSTASLDDAEEIVPGSGLYYIDFPMNTYDDLMGWYEYPIDVDSSIYVSITGVDAEDAGKISPLVIADEMWDSSVSSAEALPFEYDAYIDLSGDYQGQNLSVNFPLAEFLGYGVSEDDPNLLAFPAHIALSLDVQYSWLLCDENSFHADNSGGMHEFDVNTYYYPNSWNVKEENEGTMPDWINWYYDDIDETTGIAKFIVEVEELPAGVSGRSTDLTLEIPGSSKVFHISQGEAGVEAVETSANRVSVVNGNFEVEAASATSVDVYNVAGQKVASAAIEGTTVVPAQDLAKGLYILKFNDNTAVKVMK